MNCIFTNIIIKYSKSRFMNAIIFFSILIAAMSSYKKELSFELIYALVETAVVSRNRCSEEISMQVGLTGRRTTDYGYGL